ncbi:hypothetical protein EDD22DRAFT_850150 [Suillus occidentalis]|nr:hypothetical protein EDD22DRAFT_850150 [Suillus occidentalis]
MYYKSLFPDLPKVPESNVHHLLFNRPDQREWPDYTLFVNVATGQRRSFREFIERVRDGATALGADVTQGGLGLRPENGDIVGILSENCTDYIALVHSLLAITVPFALLSSYSTQYELKHANSLAQATRIFTSPSLLQLALTLGLPADRIYLLEGESKGYTNYDQLISSTRKDGIPRLPVRHATKDTLAYLIYSSGTSGLPKAIMTSHGNITTSILSSLVNGMEMAKIRAPPVLDTPEGLQVIFNVLPLYHAVGLFTTSFFSFLNPSTIVMLPKWDINQFFDSIPKYHITAILLVPSLLHQFVHHPRFKTAEMNSVTMVGSGAAYLPPQLADQTYQEFPKVTACLNSSVTSLSEIDHSRRHEAHPWHARWARQKQALALPEFSPLVSKPALSVPTGLLQARTSRASFSFVEALRRWDTREMTRLLGKQFVDGWVRTGDRMRFDEDQGVSGGRTSDERIPRAWIVLSPAGAALGEKEVVSRLNAWVQEHLSRYKWLRGGIGIVEAIPKSPTGKVLRRVLVEAYEKEVKANAKL